MIRQKKTLLLFSLLIAVTLSSCNAQLKNIKIENVKIVVNCDSCETSIEKAGTITKIAQLDWDKNTKIAILTYDSIKTSKTNILKRVALAGFDNDQFLAPDEAYAKLPVCCRYERVNKSPKVKITIGKTDSSQNQSINNDKGKEISQLKSVFDNYFSLKDVLVKSDQKSASFVARDLLSAITAIKMDKLTLEEHQIWMEIENSLKLSTDKIITSSTLEKQRIAFIDLSSSIYTLMKEATLETPIYYQHCPMYNEGKGANWLSKEATINNPYYGHQMLSCGKTIEIIK